LLLLAQAVAFALVSARLLTGGSPEDHVALFLAAACVAVAATAIAIRLPWRKSALAGAASALLWVAGYRALVSYLDHPWLAGPETNRCDGPCFGWYTFEFDPPYLLLVVVTFGTACLGAAYAAWRDSG
jgi:hypothetical protein